MLHKAKVGRVLYYSARRGIRIALGIKPRVRAWPPRGVEATVAHHSDLVRRFLEAAPPNWDFAGKTFCEAGCSDCLTLASFLLAKGAARVDLIEPSPPVLSSLQAEILKGVAKNGFPLDLTILRDGDPLSLDDRRVTYYNCFVEKLDFGDRYDYLFSLDVMEHVEDLDGFYAACKKVLKPGGQMFHSIDFSGHDQFEDPVPPLDFQTYPDWLHDLMYPRFHRATRSFPSEHLQAMTRAGLVIDHTKVLRKASPEYLDEIWPRLRPKARSLPRDEVAMLQAVVVARKAFISI
jgi:SAM-dependent methyltransferase